MAIEHGFDRRNVGTIFKFTVLSGLLVAGWAIHGCSTGGGDGDIANRAPRGSTMSQNLGRGNPPAHSGDCDGDEGGSLRGEALALAADKGTSTDAQASGCGTGNGGNNKPAPASTGTKTAVITQTPGTSTKTGSSTSTSTSTDTSTPVVQLNPGAQLYQDNCARCHGPGQTYALNKSAQAIRAAINNRVQMRNITLSDAQLQMISSYLTAP